MPKKQIVSLSLAVLALLIGTTTGCAQIEALSPHEAQASPLSHASSTVQWAMPTTGPAALPDQTIVFIGEDLRNGGVLGVGFGVREAVTAIGWKVHYFDIGSKDENRQRVFREALDLHPSGVILVGVDAESNKDFLKDFETARIPVVGWHVASAPGRVENTPVKWNVATDSVEVAKVTAQYAITHSQGRAGVVIFTDSRFAIARDKAAIMAKTMQSCSECTLLETVDLALCTLGEEMPKVVERLVQNYGTQWQYSLAINDLYYDHAVAALVMQGVSPQGPLVNISAGDGSPSAFFRIRTESYQQATVPEPLLFHGWQLVDELNRLCQGLPASGFVTPPTLVTADTISSTGRGSELFDPANGYRDHYRALWGKRP